MFWRCDCCTCEGLFPSASEKIRVNISRSNDDVNELYKDKYIDTVLIARWQDCYVDEDLLLQEYNDET